MSSGQKFVLAVFGVLLLTCAALLLVADSLGPTAQDSVTSVAKDGFKTVLGALVGALSAIAGGRK